MPEIRTCNDEHEWVAFTSLKCPVCQEQERVLVAKNKATLVMGEKIQDLQEKMQALVDGL